MPIHIYHCDTPTCENHEEERLVKFSNAEEQTCKECGELLRIVPSFGNFALKGRWWKTTKGY